MRIYIAGKITGLDIDEAFENFLAADDVLSNKKHQVINPMKLTHDHERTWQAYMKECLTAMMTCDAVLALPNAMESKGAITEITLARVLEIPVYLRVCDIL